MTKRKQILTLRNGLQINNLTGINLAVKLEGESKSRDPQGMLSEMYALDMAIPPDTLDSLALGILGDDRYMSSLAIRDLVEEGGLVGDRAKGEAKLLELCEEVTRLGRYTLRSTYFKLRALLNEMYKSKRGAFDPNLPENTNFGVVDELSVNADAINTDQTKFATKISSRECLAQYGKHLDDGGYLMGFCVRCGECLG